MKSYVFTAVCEYCEDVINISFPDLPGCFSCASNEKDVYKNAQEALTLYL